jgi:cytidylate kinase
VIAIAIDGPAGAGKSTIARLTAKKLGYLYVDTGALYRTVGYAAKLRGIDPGDAQQVAAMLPDIAVDLSFDKDGVQQTLLNGQDVSGQIRSPEMSRYASQVSAHKAVREYLLWLQRKLAKEHNVIMDGRDIGTTVLPHADLKIYLTATPEDRARRRFDEYLSKGVSVDYDKLLNDIKQRDYDDSHREISPLRRAEDAKLVDTSGNTLEESLELMEAMIRRHLGI